MDGYGDAEVFYAGWNNLNLGNEFKIVEFSFAISKKKPANLLSSIPFHPAPSLRIHH